MYLHCQSINFCVLSDNRTNVIQQTKTLKGDIDNLGEDKSYNFAYELQAKNGFYIRISCSSYWVEGSLIHSQLHILDNRNCMI